MLQKNTMELYSKQVDSFKPMQNRINQCNWGQLAPIALIWVLSFGVGRDSCNVLATTCEDTWDEDHQHEKIFPSLRPGGPKCITFLVRFQQS